MSNLPDFIVQNPPLGDPQVPPPYRFEDVGIRMFPVVADGKKLQAICDRFLNSVAARNNSQYRIDPLRGSSRGIVYIELLHYERMYSAAAGHEELGYSRQNELLFAIPVVLKNQFGLPLAVGTFVPYLFVDQAHSLVTGRDVVGFPKMDAVFSLPSQLSDVQGCKVSTLAIKTYSKDTAIENRLLLETRHVTDTPVVTDTPDVTDTRLVTDTRHVSSFSAVRAASVSGENHRRLPEEIAKPLWPFGPIDELYHRQADFSVDAELFHLLGQSAGANLTNYSLKQFRDAEIPTKACYQGIIQGDTRIASFNGGGLLPETEISIHEYDSLKIIEHLGLVAQGTTVKPLFGFWYNADFNLKNLKNLTEGRDIAVTSSSEEYVPHRATCADSAIDIYRGMADVWLRALDDFSNCRGRRDRRP